MPDTIGQTRQATLDPTPHPPGVRWGAFVVMIVWSAVEATICAFALRPTATELFSDLIDVNVNPIALVVMLSIFLTIIIAGSFACLQMLKDAIAAKQIPNIVQLVLVQATVAIFQVLFVYRELIDQITPWLAQAGMTLGAGPTLGLASFAWVGVRGLTWFTFGYSGAPALLALLNRQAGRSTNPI